MNILYVEDNPLDADLIQRELTRHMPDSEVEVATTLKAARDSLLNKQRYDLVLLDLRLPDGNGLDLLGDIRKRALPIAVVVLTGSGDEESAVAALKAGADDYLVKREGYLNHLPSALETALTDFQTTAFNRARPLRVLYAEHESADIDLTRRHLARHAPHIHLDIVYNGDDMLERIPATPEAPCPFDVLMLDYKLPGANALEMLKILRQERALDVPIVLVTGHGDEDIAVQAWRLGATDYLVKNTGYLFKLPVILDNVFHRVQLERERHALQASEDRYRRLTENAQDLIFRYRFEPTPGFEYVNPAAIAITGYTPEEHYANPDLGFKLLHPDDRALLERLAIEDMTGQPLVLRWQRKDGKVIWTEQRNVPIIDDEGNLIALEGIARDITDRVEAQQAEREQRQFAEALIDTTSSLITALDLDAVMNTVLANVAHVVPHDAANIMLMEGDQVTPVYWRGYGAEHAALMQGSMFKVSETPNLHQMIETGSAFLASHTAAYSGWITQPLTVWVKSYVAAPIRLHGNVVGFLNLDSGTPGFFTDVHAQRLQAFADQASIAIEHAQLYEEIQRHSTELEQRVKERTTELYQAKEHIEAILNSSNDIIILCRVNGAVDQVNPAFEDVFRCTPDQFFGKSITTLVMPDHVPTIEQALANVVDMQQPQRLEATVRCPNRSAFDADIVLSPIVEQDGQLSRVICSLRDITKRKQLEDKLRQMLEHEMELNEIKSRYVSMAAHDLRNPLAVIKTAVDLIERYRDQLTTERVQNKLDSIQTQIGTMVAILDDILMLERAESGKLIFEPAPLNVVKFSHDIGNEMELGMGTSERIIVSYQGDCESSIADKKLLRHILSNLLSNALKYSPADSNVRLSVICQPEQLTFHVQDDGIGIPKPDQKQLFQAFHRASNTGSIPGTGLGLSIVKQAVDLHGGTVAFESEQGGTVFTVTLPVTSKNN